ncbi:hypothetical protein [Halalkalibacterium halodurans]|uniref:Uncharacterized protein n=1 Tax=Halalkalibacterium halodurans TaxID=86665 RepID=A0A0M0KM23_ALKHA|nr:hypothetical protein [Halalkalibacterium halodurans]TPE70691.1 hypothetical protein AMD02_001620 [Halalkalibacterium halodurans]
MNYSVIELIKDFIPAISALGGAMVGALVTGVFQLRLHKQQVKKQESLQRKAEIQTLIQTYINILKVDGENLVVEGYPACFDIKNTKPLYDQRYMRICTF